MRIIANHRVGLLFAGGGAARAGGGAGAGARAPPREACQRVRKTPVSGRSGRSCSFSFFFRTAAASARLKQVRLAGDGSHRGSRVGRQGTRPTPAWVKVPHGRDAGGGPPPWPLVKRASNSRQTRPALHHGPASGRRESSVLVLSAWPSALRATQRPPAPCISTCGGRMSCAPGWLFPA